VARLFKQQFEEEEGGMPDTIPVDPEALRADVREKYREVALHPDGEFHFHTGRPLAALLGYPADVVDALPDRAVESFAGVGNPFSLRPLQSGERVVDFGSGGGFDCFVAADAVGTDGRVVGVDMTHEMLAKSRGTADLWTGCIAGGLPVDDWCTAIAGAGFDEISVGLPVDAFGGSAGEGNARTYDVAAHVFLARRPA
jgi:SAM-dependent methyltransferase